MGIAAAVWSVTLAATGGAVQPPSRPDPRLTPQEVVRIVLDALRQNGGGDEGIATTFRFASPDNQAATGPVERFGSLVRNPVYSPLLNHRAVERGEMQVTGDAARQRVVVTTADGERVTYVFLLSRQTSGAYRGCWMTDGVTRVVSRFEHTA